MLIDRTHKPWFVVSAVIVAGGASAYWAASHVLPHGVTGGSVIGLLFGIVGSAMIVFAALLAVRKKLPTWRVGSAQWWLRGHLWLGSVGFLMILFHSGFQWGGLLENLLWISFGLVVVTGFAGLALQQVIPRLLVTRVPLETMVGQIPFLSQTNLFRADQLVAKQTGVLDIPYESLKPFAEEVLKQQRVLKRESDFPKELAKVYDNVPLPEGDAKKPNPEPNATAPAKPSPLAQMKAVAKTAEPTTTAPPVTEVAVAAPEAAPATKPKSPLELMREKAAAKVASTPPVADSEAVAPTAPAPAVKKSPLEIMREKAAAKVVSAPPVTDSEPVAPTAPAPAAKKSPIEIMREKAAAKAAAEAGAIAPPAEATTPAAVVAPAKPLSPLEIMKAKLAAQKGSTSDKPADTPKPLSIDKSDDSKPSSEPATPPPMKKPLPLTPPVTSSPPKPQPKPVAVISPAAIAQLRDFHLRAVRPFLDDGRSTSSSLNDVMAARRVFGQLNADLPPELHETLEQLESLCEERRQFNTQLRLHRWLHWWLILHIPPAIAMLVLFVAHVVVSLRVVPFVRD